MLAEFPKWVDTYKDNPGVLMWDVGNESVLGLQNCYSGDELEQQRNAYTTFVNQIAQKIHSIDPNHPVTSTDAWTGAWPYYKRNAPDLDLYAVNSYKDVCNVKSDWQAGGYDKPYIVTEGGPAGSWEVPNDANGVPAEPTDQQKADGYTNAWNCITSNPGVSLGATLFHYGNEDDFGGIWFNLVPDGLKRPSYYAVKRAYGGDTSGDNLPPQVTGMNVTDATTGVPAGGNVTVSTRTTRPGERPDHLPGALQQPLHRQQRRPHPRHHHGGRQRHAHREGARQGGRLQGLRQGHRRPRQRRLRLAVAQGRAPEGGRHRRGARQARHRVLVPDRPDRRLPVHRGRRGGRQLHHPLVERLERPAVAPGRPGRGAPRSSTSSSPGRRRTRRRTTSRPPTTARTGPR